MQFEDYLFNKQREINKELIILLDKWLKENSGYNISLIPYLNAFIRACWGGKRLRGVLIKLGYDLAKGKNKEIIKIAVAYEIFQTAILIHDDVIDKSVFRRGKLSVYSALGGDHHAISQSICLGDLGCFLSINLLSDARFNQNLKGKAVSLMSQIMHDTTLGQMLDILGAKNKNKLSEKDILDIYYQKTAKYSFIGPLQIGAIMGGLDGIYLNKLEIIGKYLGIAYQIQDDLLVVDGKEDVLGKSVLSDIAEGKATLIYYFAYNHVGKEEREFLDKYYGYEKITVESANIIKNIFVSSGAVDYSTGKVKEYLKKALREINNLLISSEARETFERFVEYLFTRKK